MKGLMTSAHLLLRRSIAVPRRQFQERIPEGYRQAIAQNDAGVIGVVCAALTNESPIMKKEIKDLTLLVDARAKLTLPKDIDRYSL